MLDVEFVLLYAREECSAWKLGHLTVVLILLKRICSILRVRSIAKTVNSLGFLLLVSCTTEQLMPEWLIGTWRSLGSKSNVFESWEAERDTMWSGMGWQLVDGDTIVLERVALINRPDGLYYRADVPHNTKPIEFRAITISVTKYVFENPAHDFPKRIIYYSPENDTLHVRIEGNGKSADFMFIREN